MGLFAWLESTSLAMWVGLSNSFFAYPLILLVHTIGLTLIVGVNLIVAVRMLGMSPQIPLSEMRKLFPIAWGGLAMNAVTGALLFIAKATQFIVNPAFYLKMASIAVAVVVLFVMSTKVFRDPMLDQKPLERRARMLALVSITFWVLAIIGGRAMAYVGEAAEFGG